LLNAPVQGCTLLEIAQANSELHPPEDPGNRVTGAVAQCGRGEPTRVKNNPGQNNQNFTDARQWRAGAQEKSALPALQKPAELSPLSARFRRKDKGLAGINTIWVSDPVPVRFVNECVSHALAIGETADTPEAVATGYNRGCGLGREHRGW
jgi:hypothetical protein